MKMLLLTRSFSTFFQPLKYSRHPIAVSTGLDLFQQGAGGFEFFGAAHGLPWITEPQWVALVAHALFLQNTENGSMLRTWSTILCRVR